MTLHDVLRALVRGELRDVDAAVAAIDAHEAAQQPTAFTVPTQGASGHATLTQGQYPPPPQFPPQYQGGQP